MTPNKSLLEWMELQEKINKELLAMIQGQQTKHLIDLDGDPIPEMWKDRGWKIEEHTSSSSDNFDPTKLELYLSPKQKDGFIVGNKLRKELMKNKIVTLNACVLDYLLLHPELIPEEWKTAGAIVFKEEFFSKDVADAKKIVEDGSP